MASKETPAAVEYEKLKKASTDALQKKLLKHIELDKEQIMAAAREKLYSWILIKKSLATGTLPILERFREKSQPEEKPAAASATSDMQILFQQNQMFLQQILKEAEERKKEAEVRQSLLLKEAEERRIAMEKAAEVRQSLLLKGSRRTTHCYGKRSRRKKERSRSETKFIIEGSRRTEDALLWKKKPKEKKKKQMRE